MDSDTIITPFRIDVPQDAIDDLHRRLDATRWPERETTDGTAQGISLDRMQALVARWRDGYDWRRVEAKLNGFAQFRGRFVFVVKSDGRRSSTGVGVV